MAVTTNYGWTLSTVNADRDTWGTKDNSTFIAIDSEVFKKADKTGATFTGPLGTTASVVGAAGFSLPAGVAPTAPVNGDLWSTTAGVFFRRGGATKTLAELEAAAFTGAVSFAAMPTCAVAPTTGNELVNKTYADAIASGYQPKTAAQLVATSNLTKSSEQTIDGVLTSASRLLLIGQTAPAENGLWTTAAGAWSRTTDMDAWSEVPGARVFVTAGSVGAGKRYYCTSLSGGTLNTTAITFILDDVTPTYTANGGIALTGSNFALTPIATQTFLGRTTASTGAVEVLTASQATAMLSPMVGDSGAGGTKGMVPAPGVGDAPKAFLGDGTFGGLVLAGAGFGYSTGAAISFSLNEGIVSMVRTANGKWTLNVDAFADANGWVPIVMAIYSGGVLTASEENSVTPRSTGSTGIQFRTPGNTLQDPTGVNILLFGAR